MGIVYEAEQTSLKRRVALKILPPALCADPRIVARFHREAEAAGRLRHPNIVPVYSVGEVNGAPYFTMERVEGRSLAAILDERRAGRDAGLPPPGDAWRAWCAETFARLADALAYAHGQGVLHRDVKPANVLLEADGTPRLTDFGLALDLSAPGLTQVGETFGTPSYMSPEQLARHDNTLDARTDVYSLGVSLYEALTLRIPYDAATSLEIFAALREGKIVPPLVADPAMPPALDAILRRALERDAAKRHPGPAAVAHDLRLFLRAPRATPAAAVPTPSEPTRRGATAPKRRLAVAIAAAVLVAGGAAALHLLRGRSSDAVESGRDLTAREAARIERLRAPPALAKAQIDEAARLGVPAWFDNPIGMRFVIVPAGTFLMGSPRTEALRGEDETQHEVTISRPYYLQATETTWGQFRTWLPRASTGPTLKPVEKADADDQPLMRVEPKEIDGFLAWLSARDPGRSYRLPTTAEWERACRAGTTTSRFWGDDSRDAIRYANLADASLRAKDPGSPDVAGDDGFATAAPVGSFLPNPWGLYDMIGNVTEWTADTYAPHGPGPQFDPFVHGMPLRGIRGAAWWTDPSTARCAFHGRVKIQAWQDAGMRLAVDVPGTNAAGLPAPRLTAFQETAARELGVPAWFENGIGMRFVLVPAGTFTMGSPSSEPGRRDDEAPHRVTISKAFYLQTTEATYAQWRRWEAGAGGSLYDGEPTDADDQPVTRVNGDANLAGFLAWLSEKDGKRRYRLPTEAEWEYACRAGSTTRWPWGDDPEAAETHGNVLGRIGLRKHADLPNPFPFDGYAVLEPAPVGLFQPNAWGLRDMIGNVAEWVQDTYAPIPAGDATDPVHTAAATDRVSRGGSWHSGATIARCADRGHLSWDSGMLWADVGVRVAVDLPTPPK
jgi:formylglycine-generating enzyme required for sulfatase activity